MSIDFSFEITKWYITGCHIAEHKDLDKDNKEIMKGHVKTLLMILEGF